VIDLDLLRRIGKRTTILHPLPRVNEVDYSVDLDTRAAYFRQASYGVPIRMALLALLLGKKRLRTRKGGPDERPAGRGPAGEWVKRAKCANPTCITNHEPGLSPRMERIDDSELLRCAYCDQEQGPEAAAGESS
jgi:hypothetical protein